MIYKTNLYAAWWLYLGLLGLGAVLILLSLGGAGPMLALITVFGFAIAAIIAWRRQRGPNQQLVTELSEHGVLIHPPATDAFLPWGDVAGVRLTPQPGYWQVWLQTDSQPEAWLLAGEGLELAENIATVAALPYREDLQQATRLGNEHIWRKE